MSSSLYLGCHKTRQYVHVSESSGGGWFRGANWSVLVGAFCRVHHDEVLVPMGEEEIEETGGDSWNPIDPYREWTPETFEALAAELVTDEYTASYIPEMVQYVKQHLAE